MILSAAIGAALATAPLSDNGWQLYQKMITEHPELDEGLTKPVLQEAEMWIELQYYLGFCLFHMKVSDVEYWRGWWNDTPFPKMQIGKKLITIGAERYEAGTLDGAKQRPSEKLCRGTLDSWFKDMTEMREKSAQK